MKNHYPIVAGLLFFITGIIALKAQSPFNTNEKDNTLYVYSQESSHYKAADSEKDNILFHNSTGTVKDVDGNIYSTLKIVSQTWMVENLKVTHYRNGDEIPNIRDTTAWGRLTTGAWCWYNNNDSNDSVYGKMYNWFAVSDSRIIAPKGWHVPADDEWSTLISFLGKEDVAGGKMKETGTAHWNSPNTGATNESGFTAIPGGYRYTDNGSFRQMGNDADWWSTTEVDATYAWFRNIYYNFPVSGRYYYNKQNGFSVRCVKDQ
ncbi:MAG: fibrobacter succinogenes major paralogous domain-containing protein [Bacteroidetes bacterium]|nr:fibrobacter succinogenes major paralogous domain-containing protein [Bacteroidota bacterium]